MPDHMTEVKGRCPACGWETLFVGEGGYITCSRLECPRPDTVTELLGELHEARLHGAFTFCDQLVGHVSMAKFAQKISEKRAAYADAEKAQKAQREAERKLKRLDQMATAWLERLPDTIRTATAAEAVHQVTRGGTQ